MFIRNGKPDYCATLGSVSEHLNGLHRQISGAMNLLAAPLMEELWRLRCGDEAFKKEWSYGTTSKAGWPYTTTLRIYLADHVIPPSGKSGWGRQNAKKRPQLTITIVRTGLGEEAQTAILYQFTKTDSVSETLRSEHVEVVREWVNTLFDCIRQDFPQVMQRLDWALYHRQTA